MGESSWAELLGLKSFPKVLLRYLLTGMLLVPIAALIADQTRLSEAQFGILCSVLSFLCALSAGLAGRRGVPAGLCIGILLCLVLLTLGVLVGAGTPDNSGILSVVSFTLSGCLVASVFFRKAKKRARRIVR